MVQLIRSLLTLSALLLVTPASAVNVRFTNNCPKAIDLQHASGMFSSFKTIAKIPMGGARAQAINKGTHSFRFAGSALVRLLYTLLDRAAEFSVTATGVTYDISVDPSAGQCNTSECAIISKLGMDIAPKKASGASCRPVKCPKTDKAACAAAYDKEKQACATSTDIDVIFCSKGRRLRSDEE
ncbi:hypothetical protein Poli38472_014779 [Pythium oligandrum]|uniref:Thaumatin-like protein n=1 Tax=Pythium oligandrum TaxID=41045 RepID=A0A8K1C234_PYTOL|nr:hypothetical protein Poli38472_014779 [Pythium oligandrum]|eukprot:TMW55008.1 hypothetical protein Poli38472_014779 [Pythium oligandrum]